MLVKPIQNLSPEPQLHRLQAWWESVDKKQRTDAYEAVLSLERWEHDQEIKEKLSPWIQSVATTVVKNLKNIDWKKAAQSGNDSILHELSLSFSLLQFALAHTTDNQQVLWVKEGQTIIEGMEELGVDWKSLQYIKNNWRGNMDSLEASIKAILMSASWDETESLHVKPKRRF